VANDNIISWNFANWVTITVMALIMFALFGLGQKYVQGNSGQAAS
jgi:hypothetical protein